MIRFPIALAALTLCPVSAFAQNTPVVLYTLDGSQAGERLGWTVAAPGDLNGDNVPDILAGGPGDFISGGFPGIVRAYSGMTGSVLYTVTGQQNADGFGLALTILPDIDGDGRPDLAVGAPYDDSSGLDSGSVYVFSGGTGSLIRKINGGAAGDAFGWSLCDGRDFNTDGLPDLVIGAPLANGPYPDAGSVAVYEPVSGVQVDSWSGSAPLAEFGYSVASTFDFDQSNPAIHFLFSGAPGLSSGRVLFWEHGGTPSTFAAGPYTNSLDGLTVTGWGCTNGAMRSAWIALTYSSQSVICLLHQTGSAPAYWVIGSTPIGLSAGPPSLSASRDGANVYLCTGVNSGAPYQPLIRRDHASLNFPYLDEHGDITLGNVPISRVWASAQSASMNSGADDDMIIGDPTVSSAGTDAGRVMVVLLTAASQPLALYCSAKINSQGCTPVIGFSGAPTLSVADNFHITATSVLNNKPGLMLWSLNQNNIPFGGGTLCVGPLFHRTALQQSHGNPPPSDCSGSYEFHFSQAYMTAQALTPGVTVYCQYYSRDDGFQAPQNIGLTGGVRFTVLP